MSDSETALPVEAPVPTVCKTIRADLDKCIKENGELACKELMEAFAACIKSNAAAS